MGSISCGPFVLAELEPEPGYRSWRTVTGSHILEYVEFPDEKVAFVKDGNAVLLERAEVSGPDEAGAFFARFA